jgi:hypothetical protein
MIVRFASILKDSGRGGDRLYRRQRHFCDPDKNVDHLLFFESELVFVMDVLVLASAATGIMATSRLYPMSGRLQKPFEAAPDKSFFNIRNADSCLVAVNCERHKDDLLIKPSHAAAAEGHAVNSDLDLISRFQSFTMACISQAPFHVPFRLSI